MWYWQVSWESQVIRHDPTSLPDTQADSISSVCDFGVKASIQPSDFLLCLGEFDVFVPLLQVERGDGLLLVCWGKLIRLRRKFQSVLAAFRNLCVKVCQPLVYSPLSKLLSHPSNVWFLWALRALSQKVSMFNVQLPSWCSLVFIMFPGLGYNFYFKLGFSTLMSITFASMKVSLRPLLCITIQTETLVIRE